jgi:putative phage-type endonuclease
MSARKKTIGASEIGAIMGLNPYTTPLDIWMVKTGRKPEFEGNDATNRGLLLEPSIAAWFKNKSGYLVESSQIRHFAGEHCSATPDFTYQTDGINGLLECKSTAMRVDADDLPAYWFLQAMFQAGVVGNINEVTIAYLCGGLNFGAESFAVDQDFCNDLLSFADSWYKRHVLADVAPDVKNVDDIKKLYKQTRGGIEASQDVKQLLAEMKDLKLEIAVKSSQLEELKSQVMLIMRDAEAIESEGKPLCTWKFSKPTTLFDAVALKEAMPEIYEKFQRQKEPNRVFLLK